MKLEMRPWCPLFLFLFKIVLEAPAGAIQQEKRIKGLQIRKEEFELPPFVDDMIVNIKDPKNSTRKL